MDEVINFRTYIKLSRELGVPIDYKLLAEDISREIRTLQDDCDDLKSQRNVLDKKLEERQQTIKELEELYDSIKYELE